MTQYRFTRDTAPIEFLVGQVAMQESVPVESVRVKKDPHPHADENEIVLCVTDALDHWPNAT